MHHYVTKRHKVKLIEFCVVILHWSRLFVFYMYLLRPILFRTCRYFTGLCSSNIPRYFLDFVSNWSSFRENKDLLSLYITFAMVHMSLNVFWTYLKPKSDIHCNRSATSPRPKFKTIAEVAEESQLGFAVVRRLVGDWSATNRGLVADWSATGRRPRGDLFATWCNWSPTGRGLVPD